MNKLNKYGKRVHKYERRFGMNTPPNPFLYASQTSAEQQIPAIETIISNMKNRKHEEFYNKFKEIDAIRDMYYKQRLDNLNQERNIANNIVEEWKLRSQQLGIQLETVNENIKEHTRNQLSVIMRKEWEQELTSFLNIQISQGMDVKEARGLMEKFKLIT